MIDSLEKIITKEVVSVLFAAVGWTAKSVWKLAKDVRVAEEKLDICLPCWVRWFFGWILLPVRVKRLEQKLGIGNGRYGWKLVRTKRVNKCFAELRRNGSVDNSRE